MSPTTRSHIALFESLGRIIARGDSLPSPAPISLLRSDPMSQIRPDLNSVLSNVERTFSLKARIERQKAAEAIVMRDKPESLFIRDGYTQAADRATRQAELWEQRAAEARNGYCQAEGRVVYQATVEDQRIQQSAAGGPIT